MYPYVIPFSGAAMSADPALAPFTVYETRKVGGTDIAWDQATKILPLDPTLRETILQIERGYEEALAHFSQSGAHLPSRVRSLIWILCSLPLMEAHGLPIADEEDVRRELDARLPRQTETAAVPQLVSA